MFYYYFADIDNFFVLLYNKYINVFGERYG